MASFILGSEMQYRRTTADPSRTEELETWFQNRILELSGNGTGTFDPDKAFRDLGLSSAQVIALTAELGDRTAQQLPGTLPFDYPTPRSLCAYVRSLRQHEEAPTRFGDSASETVNKQALLETYPYDAIAVIGIGCRFPGNSNSPDDFWSLLAEGRDAIGPIPENRWHLEEYYAEYPGKPGKMYTAEGGFLDDIDLFDPEFFGISPREAKAMDPQQRLLLEVAMQTLDEAGVDRESLAGSKTGVFVGISGSDYARMLFQNPGALDLYGGTGTAPSIAANRISYLLGLNGASISVDTACSSSLVAVHLACRSLRDGESNLALAGGVNLILSPEMNIVFSNANLMSPDGRCKAFDASANGYVRSEGCGMVLLKPLADAVKDNDHIWGVILGSICNQDGRSNGLTVPSGLAQQNLLRSALSESGVSPSGIDYLEAHGTGTAVGDPIEFNAAREVFANGRDKTSPLLIGSVKSNLGHMEQAAGIGGLIKVLISLQKKTIPASLHFSEPNPLISLASIPAMVPTVNTDLSKRESATAGVSSFSFGGTNAHVVVRKAVDWLSDSAELPALSELLVLSAHTPAALRRGLELARDKYSRAHARDVPRLCHSSRCKTLLRHRVALTGTAPQDFVKKLDLILSGTKTPGVWAGEVGGGFPLTGFAFTGQGAQYAGMGKVLYAMNTPFKPALDACFEAFEGLLPRPLRSVLHEDEAKDSPINQTVYTQPALFALEYALARMWMSWGANPSCVMGHSVGEYVAACIAGIFNLRDAARLISARGRLIQQLPGGGGMLAVFCGEAGAKEALLTHPSLALAAVNGPASIVLSGPLGELEKAEAFFSQKDIQSVHLHVSHAFHSPLMKPMLDEFRAVAESVVYSEPKTPVISNLTGDYARSGEMLCSDYWVRHVEAPVRFYDGIVRAAQSGVKSMLEVGPSSVLAGLGRAASDEVPLRWHHSLMRGQDDWNSLTDSLASMYVSGYPIDWSAVVPAPGIRKLSFPTLAFDRQSYWFDESGKSEITRTTGPSSTGAGPLPQESRPAPRSVAPSPSKDGVNEDSLAPPLESMGLLDFARTSLASIMQLPGPDSVPVAVPLVRFGVDSLMGMQLKATLDKRLGLDIPLPTILGASGLEKLLESFESDAAQRTHTTTELRSVKNIEALLIHDHAAEHEPFPLTPVQRAYWAGRQEGMELGGVGCQVYAELDVEHLELSRLEQAINRLIERHDMLRAIVLEDGTQKVLPLPLRYGLPFVDLSGLAKNEAAGQLEKMREKLAHRALPAGSWPLFDFRVTGCVGFFRLHVTVDMLICDGMSMMLLARELEDLYLGGGEALADPAVWFRDYVLAEARLRERGAFEQARDYWMRRLDSLPAGPELPLAKSPEQLGTPVFRRFRGRLESEPWQRLRGYAAKLGLTPSSALLAAFGALLGTWSASSHFCLNLTLFNRLPVHPDINNIVGDFTTLLLLEMDTAGNSSFADFASLVQQRLWNDMEHRHFSAVDVLALLRREGRTASVPIVFTSLLPLTDRPGATSAFLPSRTPCEVAFCLSQTPQVWLDHQVYEKNGALCFNWDIVEGLFPEGMVEEMLHSYLELLSNLAEKENFWSGNFPDLLPPAHKKTIAALNPTSIPQARGTLLDLFSASAKKRPEGTALVSGGQYFSYAALDRISNSVAGLLASRGVMPGDIVAVVMEKGWEQIAAVLGVFKAGAAFLPLEADQPDSRIKLLLHTARARVALTQPSLLTKIGWPDETLALPVEPPADGVQPTPAAGAYALSSWSLAYCIFTSGSTGVPKGVMQDHASVVNTVLDMNERFEVRENDVLLGLSNLNFDLSVYDIFGAFAAGATLVLPEASGRRDPEHWMELIRSKSVTIWNSAPALMNMLTSYAGSGELSEKLRLTLLSGDWIQPELPGQVRSLFPNAQVMSLGGATEAAIWSVFHDATAALPEQGRIPYGKPLANQRIMILDQNLSVRPVNVPGEIYIGGVGLAMGYLGDAEKTAERFIRHPRDGERLYRTGDLGRYLPDGSIEFMGRNDFQVKIRGHRIELGEIEQALKAHPKVNDAVVMALKTGAAQSLHAYVLAEDDLGLRSYLAQRLPSYMVPATVTTLESFPLTPNGKIDRKALPEPVSETHIRKPDDANLTIAQEKLLCIWREDLSLPNLSIEDDFFESGGDSLLAARIIARIRKEFGLSVPMNALFSTPTVKEIASLLDNASGIEKDEPDLPVLRPEPEKRFAPFPLTDIQYAYWIGRNEAFELGNVSAHFYYELDTQNLDIQRLNEAWKKLTARHDMLRAVVRPNGTQKVIEKCADYEFTICDLTDSGPAEAEKHLLELRERMSAQILPTDNPPLFDIRVSLLPDGRARLHIDIDNIIADAWSLFTLVGEWADLYEDPACVLPPLSVSFRDYMLAEQEIKKENRYAASKSYWESRSLPPAPPLPKIKQAHEIEKPVFIRRSGRLSPKVWKNFQEHAASCKVTPSSALLTAYAEILSRWSATTHFTVNTTLFNRLPLHEEVDGIVGDFTSLNLLEINLEEGEAFAGHAAALQNQLWRDLDHRFFSGVEVMRGLQRAGEFQRGAIMPVVFTSALMGTVGKDASVLSRLGDMVYSIFQTPQVWLDHQVYEEHGELVLNWDSIDELFPEGLIEDMFASYLNLLESLAEGRERWSVDEVPLPVRQSMRLEAMNDTGSGAVPLTLHGLFREQVRKTPDSPAINAPDRTLTFAELDMESDGIAGAILARKLPPDTPVAVMMEKGWEQVAAALGCLKAGRAYLPLSLPTPVYRLHRIISDSGAALTLTTSTVSDANRMLSDFPDIDCLSVDELPEKLGAPESMPEDDPDRLAYIIYTSGSTGDPKGVAMAHRGAVNTLLDINERFAVTAEDRIFALSSLSFDLSVYDIFGALAAGACIVLPSEAGKNDPAHWMRRLSEAGPTVWNSAPALMQMLLTHIGGTGKTFPESLRLAMLSGDWIDRNMAAELRKTSPDMRLVSLGGATEASIWSILHEIESVDFNLSSIPYGRAMKRQKMLVFDSKFRLCPEWVPGALYIGGEGLAEGYWNDPHKTAAAFITHPQTGERLYRTGDMARFRPEGFIEFLGRTDQQIKIRGHRVEPGEIETALMQSEDIGEALVVLAGHTDASRRLVAYLVPRPGALPSEDALRGLLYKRLPRYMIPESFVFMEAFPVTDNGKIDRKRLPLPTEQEKPSATRVQTPQSSEFQTQAGTTEALLRNCFAGILENGEILADSNFFDLGVTSFHLVQVQTALIDKIGREIPIIDFFVYPTIRDLAAHIDEPADTDETAVAKGN